MKKVVGALAVLGGLVAAFYAGMNQSAGPEIRVEESSDFNLSMAEAPRPPAPAAPVLEPVGNRAPAAAVSVPAAGARPAAPTAPVSPARKGEAVVPARKPSAADQKGYESMLAAPARYLASKTLLGRPVELRKLLARKEFGKGYVMAPIVRGVLESPAAVAALARNKTLVKAFLESPAMKDPATVKALGESPLMNYVMTSKGVQGALGNQAVYNEVFMSPQVISWASANPANQAAIGRLAQGLAR